ncbi:MAG: hypothetical protein HQL15_10295 [Candidatus Omnitrophica bacterium]|nr:hypothetical protein [Candidatus Omnitrophota bacterium]
MNIRIHNTSRRAGQAVVEVAAFGAVVIFLLGIILRSHISASANQDHQLRAMKMALQISNQNSQGVLPYRANNSRNSATVLFIEDRLIPDLNKYNTIDRSPFVASGSGTMSNRLEYPVDFVAYGMGEFGEVGDNLPIMDIYINGQHFPLTTGAYVLRILYGDNDSCVSKDLEEDTRCERQKVERDDQGNYTFYGLKVNGTTEFSASATNAQWDSLRNNKLSARVLRGVDASKDDVPSSMYNTIAWQWRGIAATDAHFKATVPATLKDVNIGLHLNPTTPNYPLVDASGSLREQTIYAVSTVEDLLHATAMVGDLSPYYINGNPHLISLTQGLALAYPNFRTKFLTRSPSGKLTGVAVEDSQLGDIDQGWDSRTSVGPKPGLMPQMRIYSQVKPGTYLEIKEGKLLSKNSDSNKVVTSESAKDHIDIISSGMQWSNNTGRFCSLDTNKPQPYLADQNNAENPVKACGNGTPDDDCFSGDKIKVTCYEPASRIIYVRTIVGDANKRKWFTDITKGL